MNKLFQNLLLWLMKISKRKSHENDIDIQDATIKLMKATNS